MIKIEKQTKNPRKWNINPKIKSVALNECEQKLFVRMFVMAYETAAEHE